MNHAEKALELLHERGWCRGQWQNEKGELCISGALCIAQGMEALPARWGPAHRVTLAVIEEQYGDYAIGFATFNDDRRTTFADVERVLEKAAVRLEEVA